MGKISAHSQWIVLGASLMACAADSVSTGRAPATGTAGSRSGAAGTTALVGTAPSTQAGSAAPASVTPPSVPQAGSTALPGSPTLRPPVVPTTGPAGAPAPAAMSAGTGAPPTMPSGAAGDICARWKADHANLSEGTWSGDAASCTVGDMTKEARDSAYRLHTLYRFMAGLDPVPMTDDNNEKAQTCALLMTANGMISHMPASTWKCYTMEGAMIANASSLSSGGAVSSVEGYMIDPGNPTTLGHRRWVLSSMLAGVGFGSSGKFSCQYQPAARAKGGKPWIAWPPPGQVPLQAMGSTWSSIDKTGWSIQSDTVDLKSAQVSIMSGGMSLPVTITQLGSGYGSTYAISMVPMGWKAAVGTYSVSVSGTSMPISYEVNIVDCK